MRQALRFTDGKRLGVTALRVPWPEAARPGPDERTAAHAVNRNETSNPNPAARTSPWIVPGHQEYARLGSGRG